MITEIEDYFAKGCGRCPRFATSDCSTRHWREGLAALREICLEAGLEETVKWGHPCYVHADRNVVVMGAYRADFRLNFFHAALMKDPAGVLEKRGPNTQHADMLRFTANGQVAKRAGVIANYLAEAMAYAAQGIKPPREKRELVLPEELVDALDSDPELADAFHALTPGRQRSYVIQLNNAKKSETRVARIVKYRDKILAGKGATDR